MFPLVSSPRYLFIAGGIGITPLLPMLTEVAGSGADWRLVYGSRRRESMAFLGELAAFGDQVRLCPQDTDGLLPIGRLLSPTESDPLTVYCCGPEALIAAVEERCGEGARFDLHTERFKPRTEAGASAEFAIVLGHGGRRLVVPPDATILDVLEEAGVIVPWSCRVGECGTCELRVLAGRPDHRDEVLSLGERNANDRLMACVSRAHADELVLGL